MHNALRCTIYAILWWQWNAPWTADFRELHCNALSAFEKVLQRNERGYCSIGSPFPRSLTTAAVGVLKRSSSLMDLIGADKFQEISWRKAFSRLVDRVPSSFLQLLMAIIFSAISFSFHSSNICPSSFEMLLQSALEYTPPPTPLLTHATDAEVLSVTIHRRCSTECPSFH